MITRYGSGVELGAGDVAIYPILEADKAGLAFKDLPKAEPIGDPCKLSVHLDQLREPEGTLSIDSRTVTISFSNRKSIDTMIGMLQLIRDRAFDNYNKNPWVKNREEQC